MSTQTQSSSSVSPDSPHMMPVTFREMENPKLSALKASDGHRTHGSSMSPRSSPYDPKMRVVRRRQFICIHNDCRKPRPNKKSNVETHVWTQHVRRTIGMPNAPYVANQYQHLVMPYMMPVDEVVQLEKEAAPLFVLANATPLSEYLSKIGKTDYIEKFAYIPRKQGHGSVLSTPVHSDDDASSVAGSYGVRSREVTPAPNETDSGHHSDDESVHVVPEVAQHSQQMQQNAQQHYYNLQAHQAHQTHMAQAQAQYRRPVLNAKPRSAPTADSSLEVLSRAATGEPVWRPW